MAGVVLSGTLDDGAFGLADIKAAGGLALAQDLADAIFTPMPQAAQRAVEVDRVGTAEELGRYVASLGRPVEGPPEPPPPAPVPPGPNQEGAGMGPERFAAIDPPDPAGPPSTFTCPDCHGSLWQLDEGGDLRRYRCRVGHSWTEAALVDRQAVELENALWMALRIMDERVDLFRKMRGDAHRRGSAHAEELLTDRLTVVEGHADVLRRVLAERHDPGGPLHHPEPTGEPT